MDKKKVSFKLDLEQLNISEANGGEIAVNNIVMAQDLPMNGVYISPDVFKASLELWTGAPIVAPSHVEVETDANTFGKITKAFIDGDKLKANAIIYADKLKAAYPVLYQKITTGQAVSGSISVYVLGFDAKATYKNRQINFIVAKLTDVFHYALLQDEMGACDVKDGCGVNLSANNNREVNMTEEQTKALLKAFKDDVVAEVAKLQATDGRSEKLDTQNKPCEFNQLVERVTANEVKTANVEAGYTALKASYAEVTEENTQLKSELTTLKATFAQLQNNSTGTSLKASGEQQDTLPKYVL